MSIVFGKLEEMKQFLLAFLSLTVGAVSFANIVYVDDDNFGKSGMDGQTEATAYGTVQEAANSCAAGDEIVLLPGYYDQGGEELSGYGHCRVVLKRAYTIRARDGLGSATIAGLQINGGNGLGAYRCAGQNWVRGTIFRDIVFENGATESLEDVGTGRGGAVLSVTPDAQTALVGCIVRNCTGGRGVLQNCTAFRTLFCDNRLVDTLCRQSQVYSCVFTRNYGPATALVGALRSAVVNCTFVGNHVKYDAEWCDYVCNSLSYCSGREAVPFTRNTSEGAMANNVFGETAEYQVLAPMLGDFRLLPGVVSLTSGDAYYLSAAFFHEKANDKKPAWTDDELFRDFSGKPLPASGTTVAGAFSEAVAPAGGGWQFKGLTWTDGVDGKRRGVSIDGAPAYFRDMYAFPASYPVSWKVSTVQENGGNETFICWKTSGQHGYSHYGDTNNVAYVLPPPAIGVVVTNTFKVVDKAPVWVSPDGSDETGDGTEAAPYQTMQKGLEVANGTIVYCKPGTYRVGGSASIYKSARINSNWQAARFIAVGGKEQTFVEGEADPDTGGNGPKAVAGVVCNGEPDLSFTGFTFRNCHSWDETGTDAQKNGSICYASSASCKFIDCDFQDCRSVASIMHNAVSVRCRFFGCTGQLGSARFAACYFADMPDQADWPGGSCYFCTYRNAGTGKLNVNCVGEGGDHVGRTSDMVTFFNAIMHGFRSYLTPDDGYEKYPEPLFVAPTAESGVVAKASPVFGRAKCPTESDPGSDMYKYVDSSMDGRFDFASDHLALGAYQRPSEAAVRIVAPNGGLSPEASCREVGDAGVEIRAAEGDRPCYGYVVNGVTNLFGRSDVQGSFTRDEIVSEGGYLEIVALYTNVWYVSSGGDDRHAGSYPEAAFASFAKVMGKAVSGDRVRALPGTYGTGQMVSDENLSIAARVVVPGGVTLESTDGAENTVILGQSATEPDDLGCGPDALRCVYLKRQAKLRGFTLTGGRTYTYADTAHVGATEKHYSPDHSGAGVYAESDGNVVSDCIISNCASYRAVNRYADFVRCRFFDNWAAYVSSAVGEGNCYGCVADRCFGTPFACMYEMADCTLGVTFRDPFSSKAVAPIRLPMNGATIVNTVCHAPDCDLSGYAVGMVRRSYFAKSAWTRPEEGVMTEGSEFLSDEELAGCQYEPDTYRPVPGSSPLLVDQALDAADTEKATGYRNGFDAFGGQRIYNGVRDIGAVEADWRPVYRSRIGRRLDVLVATPGVVATADGTVLVPDGESLSGVIVARNADADKYVLSFTVPENATATLTVDGVETKAGVGAHEVRIETQKATLTPLTLAASGGGVTLGRLRRISGSLFIVR